MNQFTHFVLTRFNVKTEFSKGDVPDDTWLRHRFELFDRYAYASLRGQSVEKFVWLVFFDAETPRAFRRQISSYAKWPNFKPHFVESLEIGTAAANDMLQKIIRPYCAPETTHIITTRFDNDDAVSKHFLANIQEQFCGQSFQFVNFPNGYILQRGKLYKKRHLSNPFISLIEEVDDFRTVWLSGHHKLSEAGEIAQVEHSPQWLQVVHQRNFRNQMGVGNLRVPLRLIRREFCFELDQEAINEPQWAIRLENNVKGFRMRNRKRLARAQQAARNIWTRGVKNLWF